MTGDHTEESLTEILNHALDAINSGRRGHVYRREYQTGRRAIFHLERDIERLQACFRGEGEILDEIDYWGVIVDCLEEALQSPLKYYKEPEEKIASHPEVQGLEMFAFVVKLRDFTRPIYTKFCLQKQSDGTWYFSIDCHT